jgi:hypothetical protein
VNAKRLLNLSSKNRIAALKIYNEPYAIGKERGNC